MIPFREKQGIDNGSYIKYLKALSKLSTFELESDKVVLDVEKSLVKHGLSMHQLMSAVAQPCNEMLMSCEIRGDVVKCDTLFRKIRSNEGYCCSFNYFALRDHLELDM